MHHHCIKPATADAVEDFTTQRPLLAELPAPHGLAFLRRQLNDPTPSRPIRLQSPSVIQLSETEGSGTVKTGVHLTRLGTYQHPTYGVFDITQKHFDEMINNFQAGTYGQKIFIDVEHIASNGAAAEITRLYQDGEWLKVDFELTEYGAKAIRERKHIYLSADYDERWVDSATGTPKGCVLLGAGLTTRPFVKNQPGIQLAELTTKQVSKMNAFLKLLKEAYAGKQLSEQVQAPLLAQFQAEATPLGEDETALNALTARYTALGETVAKQLAEQSPTQREVNIQIGMTETQVKAMLEQDRRQLAEAQASTAKKLSDNQAVYTTAIAAATGLSPETQKVLSDSIDLISGDMTEAQIKRLAERLIEQANQMEATRKLSAMGFRVEGSPRISVDDSNVIRQLNEKIRTGLQSSYLYGNQRLVLAEEGKESPFVKKVLAEFDRLNAHDLYNEGRQLSGGTTSIGDTALPKGFQRQVIREALSDLNILDLVQTLTDPGAKTTTEIPYETRDTSAVRDNGIVAEGGAISAASISQAMDSAYIFARKLAMIITNEVAFFSITSGIDWDAYARNVESNARVMRELVAADIANNMQRNADLFGAVAVADENLASQLAGAKSTVKTANFPIVRPYQQKDLRGNNIGNAVAPIVVKVNGTTIQPYNGTGTQSAGTYYYVSNYNLGYITFVSEAGAAVTPTHSSGATTISYSKSMNHTKFDLDIPSGADTEKYLNGLLRAVGDRKAVMAAQRYINPDFLLMSPVLNNTASNAEMFASERKRSGSDTNGMGDLETIKSIATYGTNAPGIDLGAERILMGVRGSTTYTLVKPYVIGQPFEMTNSLGQPIGKRQAYGEEYAAIHTPAPIRNRYTSVIAYSVTARAAV